MNIIERFLYGKLNVDEVKSPLFKKNKEKFIYYFFEQYKLKMKFVSNLGWRFETNQRFNLNRKIEKDGYQFHFLNEYFDFFGFFSGSTGWGWGIFKEEDMISYKLAYYLNKNCINYAQVAYNLFNIYHQIISLKLNNSLPNKNIIYFGINEVFTLANNKSVIENLRDLRINKSIEFFEKYYYNIPLGYKEQIKLFLRRLIYDLKQIKNYFFIKEQLIKDKIELNKSKYEKNKKVVLNLIKEISELGDFIFVLEPSLFHKKYLTDFEKKNN